MINEAEEKVRVIRENLKAAQSWQKSYYDKHHQEVHYEIGDKAYLRVSPLRGVRRFGIKGKLAPRYVGPLTFYYFNATAFATSLVITVLLLNERFYKSEAKVAALTLTTMVDLMSLVGAYIAGSTRDMPSSIYIIVLTCFLFVCIVFISRVLPIEPVLRRAVHGAGAVQGGQERVAAGDGKHEKQGGEG